MGGRHQDGAAALVSLPLRRPRDVDAIRASRCARPADAAAALSQNTLWECPQLFEIDGRHVLVLSVEDEGVPRYVGYAVGQLGRRPVRRRELGTAELQPQPLRADLLPRCRGPPFARVLALRGRGSGLGGRAERSLPSGARRRRARPRAASGSRALPLGCRRGRMSRPGGRHRLGRAARRAAVDRRRGQARSSRCG